MICDSEPAFHALVDTGALITGFDNLGVARFMVDHMPTIKGCVFLDSNDQQQVYMREGDRVVTISQCGLK